MKYSATALCRTFISLDFQSSRYWFRILSTHFFNLRAVSYFCQSFSPCRDNGKEQHDDLHCSMTPPVWRQRFRVLFETGEIWAYMWILLLGGLHDKVSTRHLEVFLISDKDQSGSCLVRLPNWFLSWIKMFKCQGLILSWRSPPPQRIPYYHLTPFFWLILRCARSTYWTSGLHYSKLVAESKEQSSLWCSNIFSL